MRLLDLYCGAGGAAVGYHRAGFTDIVGVDIETQKRYPFEFVQADTLGYLAEHGHEFDVIHASPPCQAFSNVLLFHVGQRDKQIDLLTPTREALEYLIEPAWTECDTCEDFWCNIHHSHAHDCICKPIDCWKYDPYAPRIRAFIIENVPGAPLTESVLLCGSMFRLAVRRHRYFECYPRLWFPPAVCRHSLPAVAVYGHYANHARASAAMGINWMTRDELAQAIPPAYTEWIGEQLLKVLEVEHAN